MEKKFNNNLLELVLDFEDQMGGETYGEYLKKETWPANLPDDLFKTIQAFLNTLIDETEDHKQVFLNLKKQLSDATE